MAGYEQSDRIGFTENEKERSIGATEFHDSSTQITVEAQRKMRDRRTMRRLEAIALLAFAFGMVIRIWSSHRG